MGLRPRSPTRPDARKLPEGRLDLAVTPGPARPPTPPSCSAPPTDLLQAPNLLKDVLGSPDLHGAKRQRAIFVYSFCVCGFFCFVFLKRNSEGFKKNVRLEDYTPKGVQFQTWELCLTSFKFSIFPKFLFFNMSYFYNVKKK